MNRKDFVKDYLQFTYKERIAVIALVVIIVFLIILPHLFPVASAARTIKADTSWMAAANKVMQKKADTVYRTRYISAVVASSDRQPGNYRYSSFYRHSYYNDSSYRHPYKYANYHYTNSSPFHDSFPRHPYYTRPIKKIENVEINTADSTALDALPGIGPYFARHIVMYRNKLGGFYSIEQVKEVYGLSDSTFQEIKPYLTIKAGNIHTINVNTATKEQLKAHPYIRWQLANMIVDYRNQHGKFAAIDDLKKIQLITDEVFAKIKPYLSL